MTLRTVLITLFCASQAIADQATHATSAKAAQKDKACNGMITAVDQKEKTVSVRTFLFNKTFNISDNCRVSLEDNPDASVTDLHPGQKVDVHYESTQGVMVAHRIVQHNLVFVGYITSIDPDGRKLVVKHGASSKDFVIDHNCQVVLNDDKSGGLEDLRIGHTVNVVYESAHDTLAAHRIEQKYETFVGNILAIDAGTRTVKAKRFLEERKFNLAKGCQIVIQGRKGAGLSDLRIGDRVAFSYEDADGVLVANRIGLDETTHEGGSTKVTKADGLTP